MSRILNGVRISDFLNPILIFSQRERKKERVREREKEKNKKTERRRREVGDSM